MSRDPQTLEEWQEAANTAEFFLRVHAAIAYGLITGPHVDADRCDEILKRAAALGIAPATYQGKRRGRKGMSAEEREVVSERMKKYWDGRRKTSGGAS